jgi:starch phosphorylase
VPLYYRRDDDGVPTEWMRMAKRSMVKLGPQVESTRMLREYVEELYEPAAVHADRMSAESFTPTRSLVRWARHLDRAWPSVAVVATSFDEHDGHPGRYRLCAQVVLGDLDSSDVAVQAICGAVDLDEELLDPAISDMAADGDGDFPGWRRYLLDVELPRSGNFGFTVRVVPRHPDVADYTALGHVAWAPRPVAPA